MHRGPKIPINILISCSAGQRAVTSMCLMKSLEWRNSARHNCKSFDGQCNTSISIGSAFLGRLCNLVAHCVFLRVGGLATASNSEHMCGGIPESGSEDLPQQNAIMHPGKTKRSSHKKLLQRNLLQLLRQVNIVMTIKIANSPQEKTRTPEFVYTYLQRRLSVLESIRLLANQNNQHFCKLHDPN